VPASDLTWQVLPANTKRMAHSFLIFGFGGNEDLAQQARHRIDGWKQGFRLDKKLQLKFDRKELQAAVGAPSKAVVDNSKAKPASKGKSKSDDKTSPDSESGGGSVEIHMIVRLDFSDHEKLSHQRWLERIPGEEPFKTANPKIVRLGDTEFEAISEKFDSLD
jgi:hypothetical protein